MNLDGYSSDEDLSSRSAVSTNSVLNGISDTEPSEKPAFVAISSLSTSFGGVIQKAIPIQRPRSRPRPRTISRSRLPGSKRKLERQKDGKKRTKFNDPEDIDYRGPWAGSESSDENLSKHEISSEDSCSDDIVGYEHVNAIEEVVSTEVYTEENFMSPTDKSSESHEVKSSFPKKLKHTFEGHSKGVTRVRFFPKSGHLLLSCGNDGKIFLWNVSSDKVCKVRGYFGHSQAVKDIIFNSSGKMFVSCSYDRKIIFWDTESGKIIKQLEVSGIPNCAIFNPKNENEIVVGLSNRKIEHYDLHHLESPIQVYDHHLDAINSLSVLGSREGFISTSSDRSVRIWKWHVNIPTKIIGHPNQQSFYRAVVHPSEKYICFSSADDTIYVVQEGGKYKLVKHKKFQGHHTGGYGIDIGFSVDGTYLMTGDYKGYIVVWSWKTCGVIYKIKVSDELVSTLAVHPSKSNVVAAAGKNGKIYIIN